MTSDAVTKARLLLAFAAALGKRADDRMLLAETSAKAGLNVATPRHSTVGAILMELSEACREVGFGLIEEEWEAADSAAGFLEGQTWGDG
jgi:hypothetical protein